MNGTENNFYGNWIDGTYIKIVTIFSGKKINTKETTFLCINHTPFLYFFYFKGIYCAKALFSLIIYITYMYV